MALIQRPDLVEKARAQFGVLQGEIGSTMADEMVGVVIIEDVSGDDVVSTQHPVSAIGNSNSQAAVGFVSKVGLQNPVGSSVDLFVERVVATSSTTPDMGIRRGVIAANPNAGLTDWRDGRVPGNPAGIVWDENATGSLGTQVLPLRMRAGNNFLELGLTLSPGQSIHLQGGATNEAVEGTTFFWVERIRRE